MTEIILAAMAVMLLGLAVLIFVGGRWLRPAAAAEADSRITAPWPRVAVLVPVTGAPVGLRERLEALLNQDYPDYQVLFATRDAADPATAVISALIRSHPRARQVLAGPARSCGQKNLNLLAALKLAGRTPEILVFCDSNQERSAEWLRELTAPLVLGRDPVSSGFHHVIAANPGVAALGRTITVLALYLVKGFRRLNQPWGGSTAIRRSLFDSLGVAALWAENVVDDVSLAARLAQAGVRVGIPRGAHLFTPLEDEALKDWSSWLTRQWLYLKFCLPLTWLAGGLVVHLLLALVALAAVGLLSVLLPLGLPNVPLAATASALFLAGLTWRGFALRTLHPRPGPRGRWLAAYFAAMAMASWCHGRTLFATEMHWRGITYRVGWRGRVLSVSGEQ